jgi:sortase (surface protein transpeptidase)
MPRRTLALALFFLLFTSFKGQPGESRTITAQQLAGSPLAAAPSAGAPAAHRLVSPWTPTELVIPRIGVDAVIEARGLDGNRNLDTPSDFRNVAWYRLGPAPGLPGNALINGHVNWWTGSAVFTRLSQLRRGDEVVVIRGDSSRVVFKVTSRTVVAAGARIPSLFTPSQVPTLTLITCTGAWDRARGTDTQRLLVSAVLA